MGLETALMSAALFGPASTAGIASAAASAVGAIGSIAPIAGGIATIASSISGYKAEKRAASQLRAANAAAMAASQEEARLARMDAEERARQERKDAKRVRSQQLALYLKSGVTLEGSPMLVGKTTIEEGKKSASNVIQNAESHARSILLRGQASQQYVQGPSVFGTAADIVTGAGSLLKGK